jgi:hypothetical protein
MHTSGPLRGCSEALGQFAGELTSLPDAVAFCAAWGVASGDKVGFLFVCLCVMMMMMMVYVVCQQLRV